MKMLLLVVSFLLAVSIEITAPARASAQDNTGGQLTLTSVDGMPVQVLQPSGNQTQAVVIVGPLNPNPTNWQQLLPIELGQIPTNLTIGGPIQVQPPTNVLVVSTNVTPFPPITLLQAPLTVETSTNGHFVTVQWETIFGVNYQIQESRDQIHWQRLRAITGNGEEISVSFLRRREFYYRVVITLPEAHPKKWRL